MTIQVGGRESFGGCAIRFEITIASVSLPWGKAKFRMNMESFPGDCVLNGTWKLLFTDAADATFRRGKRTEPWSFLRMRPLPVIEPSIYIYILYSRYPQNLRSWP